MSLCFFLHDLYCLRDDPSLSTVPHRWTKKWVKQKTLMFSFYSYCGWYRVQFYFYGIEEALNGGLFSVLLTTIPGDIWSFEKTTLRIWLFCLLAILRKRRLFFQKLCCFMAWLFVGYGKEHIIGKRVHKSAICDTKRDPKGWVYNATISQRRRGVKFTFKIHTESKWLSIEVHVYSPQQFPECYFQTKKSNYRIWTSNHMSVKL